MKEWGAEQLRHRLQALADPAYRDFSAKLLPPGQVLLGVRLPALRRLARDIAAGDWSAYLAGAQDATFEEVMLQGMVIGYAPGQPQELLQAAAAFLPKVDNWSVCDSFCAGFKLARRQSALVWDFALPYAASEGEFDVRFAAVLLRAHYLCDTYIGRVLPVLAGARHPGYYARMAVAWALADCYIKYPDATLPVLRSGGLDEFAHNKALQKLAESRRVPAAEKAMLRTLKR